MAATCRRLFATAPAVNVVFSGIQSSGVPHIGNYIGAIQSWVKMQNDPTNKVLYSVVGEQYPNATLTIADWHSITVPQDPKVLRQTTRDAVTLLLASGINPKKCIVFQQSAVPEHVELAWILGCLTSTGALNRMTQWKAKAQKQEVPCLGLYTYPVLMAADILLYKATHVPVGDDQDQHLELTRDLADIFNSRFQQGFFPPPKAIYSTAPRVLDLRNPTAVTDNNSTVTYEPATRPAVSNLVTIYGALAPTPMAPQAVVAHFAGKTSHEFKTELAEVVVAALQPVQAEMKRLEASPEYIDAVLRDGALKARELAAKTMADVRRLVGLAHVA